MAQNNLEIIDYYEATKLISKYSDNLSETPVIAIIDEGVNLKHEDLISNIWKNNNEIQGNGIDDDKNGFIDDIYGWNFENNTNDVSIGGVGNWHGTPVNGIIGANSNNNVGIKGICPKVKLMNIVKGESIESIIKSLQYVYQMRKIYNQTNGKYGAYIVALNCSWGKDSLWASDYPNWCAMYDSLGSVGVLSVHSVPNDNIDVDIYGDMPTTCESNFLITVTNSNLYDQKVYDAGYGKNSVDLVAPGDNSLTTLNSGGYGRFYGTSAAAPYVSGAIGLLYLLPSSNFQQYIKNYPDKAALIIKSTLMKGVELIPDFTNLTVSSGRLNVYKSIKLLSDYFEEAQLYKNLFDPLKIISIYPNPANQQTTLQLESDTIMNISLYITNIYGKEVYKKDKKLENGFSFVPIDLSTLINGVYIVNIKSSNASKKVKLIIRK